MCTLNVYVDWTLTNGQNNYLSLQENLSILS